MSNEDSSLKTLQAVVENLRSRLAEKEDILRAIGGGEVDAFVVSGADGEQIFTLKGAEHPYRVMVETMNEGAAALIADGTVFYCNNRLATMLQIPMDSLIGTSFGAYISPADRPLFAAQLEEGAVGCASEEITMTTATGHPVPVLISTSALDVSGSRGVSVVVTGITERKRMEAELRESEERLQLALESGQMGMWEWDLRSKLSVCNDTEYQLLGMPKGDGELDTEEFFKTVHPDDLAALHEALAEAAAGRAEYLHEFRIVRPDGQVRWLAGRGRMYRDDVGRPVRMTGVNFDITANKLAEENLLRNEREARATANELAALMDTVPALTFVALEPECRWISCSRQTRRLLRLPEGANVSFSAREGERPTNFRLMKDNRELAPGELPLQIAVTGREVRDFEMTVLFDDGTSRDLLGNAVPLFDESGKVRGAIGAFVDITDRKLAEEAVRESEQKFRTLTENAPVGIYLTDPSGGCLYTNAYWREMSELTEEEAAGSGWEKALHPEDRDLIKDSWFRSLQSGGHWEYEYRFMTPAGKITWLQGAAFPIKDCNDRITGYIGTNIDITERKLAEVALRESEQKYRQLNETLEQRIKEAVEELHKKNKMLIIQGRQAVMGEMIGNIAHQWRQPLNLLGLVAQELPVFYKRGEFSAEYLNANVRKIMESIQQMSKTIDDFRSFFQTEKEMVNFNVHAAIEKTMSLLDAGLKASGIMVEIEVTDDISINGYPNEFAQVILNIVNNARDALVERKAGNPAITIRSWNEGGEVVVTVSDNAGGIPAGIIDKVFEPYFTTKGPDKGTGIGLYMSKTIIEEHMNGRLSVRNHGDGAEFRIEI